VIEIDPNITFAVIDITRHGKTGITKSYLEFTNYEVNIINSLFAYILENMRLAWSGIINIQPKLCKLETDPKSIKVIAPVSEMTVLVSLAVNIIGINGMINFCIPFPVIESVFR
jgi:flagellar motor switch protein FliM